MATSNLVSLPNELLSLISSYLPNRDIKNLRLTCSSLRYRARLRLDRVFLSANPRNVDVFRAIADHEVFLKGIVEIIWDDSRLAYSSHKGDQFYAYDEPESSGTDEDCPAWFSRACQENVKYLVHRKRYDVDRQDHVAREQQVAGQLPLKVSWEYYQGLLRLQEDVLASEADIDALKFGLERFPALRRITITPAAHGWLFEPLYETPMIRDFPYGFNYQIPRGWPTIGESGTPVEASPWASEAEKDQWRGFRVIAHVLAKQQHHHRVSELVIDTNQLTTGLNSRIFDQPCTEYNDLVTILQRPGFRRLHLPLIVGGQQHDGWPAFRNGHLQHALAAAPDMHHIHLSTDVAFDPDARARQPGSGGCVEHFIPLQTIFPVNQWPRLQHLGLSRFLVMQDDVVALLAALPLTLKSVELSFLEFLDNGGDYRSLLTHMRDTLNWRDRATGQRPRVSVGILSSVWITGRVIWVDNEVAEFLYGDGESPFGTEDGRSGNVVFPGKGIVRDAFEPEHARPYASPGTLAKFGYYVDSPWLVE